MRALVGVEGVGVASFFLFSSSLRSSSSFCRSLLSLSCCCLRFSAVSSSDLVGDGEILFALSFGVEALATFLLSPFDFVVR